MSLIKKLLGKTPKIDWDSAKRNEPCPCGSGKKYKACHWDQVAHKKRQEGYSKFFQNPK